MRDELEIEQELDRFDRQIHRLAESDDPLKSVLLTFLSGKRTGLLTVHGDDDHDAALNGAKKALTADLSHPQFVEMMSIINSIEWAKDERDYLA